jgi:hypothetical protein
MSPGAVSISARGMVMSRTKGMLKKTSRMENLPPVDDLTMDASPLPHAEFSSEPSQSLFHLVMHVP